MTNNIYKKIRRFFPMLLYLAKPIIANASNDYIRSGIDVSKWQGKIDWAKVKAAGVQFALLRAGYGDTLNYPAQIDSTFEHNYSECKRLGIPVGIYWYSYATTPEMARQEARSCLAVIKDKQLDYPVYYDVEEMRIFNTGKTNDIIKAFADTMGSSWVVGIYMYRSAVQSYLNDYTKTHYAMAIAEYGPKLNYTGPYGVWQNSSTYRVNGINGNVDHDYAYVDYPAMMKKEGKNGYPAPATKLMYKVTKNTPIVNFEGEAVAGKTYQVYGRKTVDGVQYGRVTANGWISLKDAKQV